MKIQVDMQGKGTQLGGPEATRHRLWHGNGITVWNQLTPSVASLSRVAPGWASAIETSGDEEASEALLDARAGAMLRVQPNQVQIVVGHIKWSRDLKLENASGTWLDVLDGRLRCAVMYKDG